MDSTKEQQPLPTTPPIRLTDALGREVRSQRVRRTIRRAFEAGRARIEDIVGFVSALTAGRATRPLAVIPVRVQAAAVPFRHDSAPGGCCTVGVASPSATLARQG